MAQTSDNSLEQRIADLESQVRSLRATNLTDLASVVDASGASVPLAQLAFGMVSDELVDYVNFTGAANTFSGADLWTDAGRTHPTVRVLVGGSRLRVDLSGTLFAEGNHAYIFMSYDLIYLGPKKGPAQRTVVSAAVNNQPVSVQDQNNVGIILSVGSFGLHSGLTSGWYSVEARYVFGYAPTSTGTSGSVQNPALAATPY